MIDLPDDLMVEVKIAAARRRISLRTFIEAALRKETADARAARSHPKRIRWTTIPGEFAPGLDVSNREIMYARFDDHRDRD